MPVDFKKSTAPLNTLTWNTVKLSEKTGNIYEKVNIMTKRDNQISIDLKDELSKNFKSLPLIPITGRGLKTVNRLKFREFKKDFQNH